MRKTNWTPSIVPSGEDQTVYLVAEDFGKRGRAWREADYEETDLETVIQDLLSGQYNNPIKVVAFNTEERWSEDVSEDEATNCAGGAIYRREMYPPPSKISSSGTKVMLGGNYPFDWSDKIRIFLAAAYLTGMRKSAFQPCIPTRGTKVPDLPDWIHEVKYDGFRLIVQREGKRVRLFTRNGHDWSDKYPLIVEAALRNRSSSFVIDGEAVLLGVDGRPDFDGLHSRHHNDEVQFYAFDILVADGEDVRKLPLSMRKMNLSRLLARRVDGIFLSDFEQGEIGPDLFRHACLLGLEGLVSKHKDRPYRAGRSPHWIKIKNPKHPAMTRVQDAHRC